jgi:hypothetical protein
MCTILHSYSISRNPESKLISCCTILCLQASLSFFLLPAPGTRYTALSMLTKQVLPTWPHLMHFTLAFNELHAEAAKLLAGALHDAPNLVCALVP